MLDTQGAELLVLKGAAGLLHRFQFIKVEAADFESYANGCRVLRKSLIFSTSTGFVNSPVTNSRRIPVEAVTTTSSIRPRPLDPNVASLDVCASTVGLDPHELGARVA